MRARPRLTQEQLADWVARLGVRISRASIAKIEIDLRYVRDFELLILVTALKVSATWLLPVRTALQC